ncbi:MAG TPA: hypothetical protein VGR56_01065 [Nitrososphaerales archaeon]|nr:hypothetical protein [Nitrososphaerales archaeon]
MLNFTAFFRDYSELAIHYNGTSNGQSYNITEDYHVLVYSATGFKVNITASSGGNTLVYTAFVFKNGTAAWVAFSGQNYTGTYANTALFGAMAAFFIESIYTSPALLVQFTNPNFVHVTGSGTAVFGSTTVNEVTYAPIVLPFVFQNCGTSGDFTNFTIQTGTVQGKSQVLLTKLKLVGSFSSGGNTSNLDFLLAITWVTKT